MIWILLGVLLALCIRNNFNAQGVAKDLRGIARAIRKIAKDLARTVRRAAREAGKQTVAAREAAPAQETMMTAASAAAEPVQAEGLKEEKELPEEPELHARTAAMMADVPVIAFPKDDPKYDSSKKYMYA